MIMTDSEEIRLTHDDEIVLVICSDGDLEDRNGNSYFRKYGLGPAICEKKRAAIRQARADKDPLVLMVAVTTALVRLMELNS